MKRNIRTRIKGENKGPRRQKGAGQEHLGNKERAELAVLFLAFHKVLALPLFCCFPPMAHVYIFGISGGSRYKYRERERKRKR